MAKGSSKSLGTLIISIALGILLLMMGILTVQLSSNALKSALGGDEVVKAVYSVFNGKTAKPIVLVLGICEILSGAFLLLNIFVSVGKLKNIFLLIILILWIAVIVLVDVLGPRGITKLNWNSTNNIFSYFKALAEHLLVLGGLLTVWKS